MSCDHSPSTNPRHDGACVKCGRRIPVENERPRNLQLERELTDLAARAAGFPHDGGLGAFADSRALPGGVRQDRDFFREFAEELADARAYAVWAIEAMHEAYLAGEPDACEVYTRMMRALEGVLRAWWALHG